jgi:hypothetical protein
MSLLWILLIVVLAVALFGALSSRGGLYRRDAGVDVVPDGRRGGFFAGPGLVGLLVVVALVILLVSLLN